MGSNRPGMLFGEKRKLLWSLLAGQSPFLIHRKLWYGTHSQHIRNLLVFFLLWMFYFSELMFAWRTVLVRECWCRKLISIAFKFFSFFSFSLSLSLFWAGGLLNLTAKKISAIAWTRWNAATVFTALTAFQFLLFFINRPKSTETTRRETKRVRLSGWREAAVCTGSEFKSPTHSRISARC